MKNTIYIFLISLNYYANAQTESAILSKKESQFASFTYTLNPDSTVQTTYYAEGRKSKWEHTKKWSEQENGLWLITYENQIIDYEKKELDGITFYLNKAQTQYWEKLEGQYVESLKSMKEDVFLELPKDSFNENNLKKLIEQIKIRVARNLTIGFDMMVQIPNTTKSKKKKK